MSILALHQDLVLGPVTALAFYNPAPGRLYLLSGEDEYLRVYDVETSRLFGQLRVFEAQAIHGIHVGPGEKAEGRVGGAGVLLWGHRLVAVVPWDVLEALILHGVAPLGHPLATVTAPDWIFDGALSPHDAAIGALVTAHNEVVPVQIRGGRDGAPVSLELGTPLQSPSRPILYSANLVWLPEGGVLVAAGTVFGEIRVWRCHLGHLEPGFFPRYEELFVFTGHEGSVFGVTISPEIRVGPEGVPVRLLASCSDDRTVRVWDITERRVSPAVGMTTPTLPSAETPAKRIESLRETGFYRANEELVQNQDSSRALASIMGHISRIWRVKFDWWQAGGGERRKGGILNVYSFGEDATAQKWNLDLDFDRLAPEHGPDGCEYFMGPSQTLRAHGGKHIWAAAVLSQDRHEPLIATGGSDGKIALMGMPAQESPGPGPEGNLPGELWTLTGTQLDISDAATLSVHHNPCQIPRKSTQKGGDVFKSYVFDSQGDLFSVTTAGRLLHGRVGQGRLQWTELAVPDAVRDDLKSYSVVKSAGEKINFLGTAGGNLYLNTPGVAAKKISCFPSKIADIFLLSAHVSRESTTPLREETTEPTLRVLVTYVAHNYATILTVDSFTLELVPGSSRELSLSPGFVITSAATCNGFLVLGSRTGPMAVYRELDDGNFMPLASTRPEYKDAITSIVPLPTKPGRSATALYLATARDGKYRIYEIDDESESNTKITLRHETLAPFKMVLEDAAFLQTRSGEHELILFGFHSTHFIVWNESRREEVARVECGGAHRSFTYYMQPGAVDTGRLQFAYNKSSRLHVYSQDRARIRTLRAGTHGREIRSVGSCGDYLATGAEDTTVRIWRYQDTGETLTRGLRCLAVMERHTTGIQCVKWHGTGYLLTSAGNEELFIWKVSRLETEYDGLAVFCEAAYPDRTPDGDLRIVDFEVDKFSENDEMCISLVLSNSTLKTYQYSARDGFVLRAQGRYTGACLTQIRHLRNDAQAPHVLTSSTDGHVAIWSARYANTLGGDGPGPAEYSLGCVTRLHQNSIKSLDFRPISLPGELKGSCWFVATGGDDNALGLLVVRFSAGEDKCGMFRKSVVREAHCAAITGVKIVDSTDKSTSSPSSSSHQIVTVSNDQRVKTWAVKRKADGACRVKLLANMYSSVADPGDIEPLSRDGRRYVVAGVGLEVWGSDLQKI